MRINTKTPKVKNMPAYDWNSLYQRGESKPQQRSESVV